MINVKQISITSTTHKKKRVNKIFEYPNKNISENSKFKNTENPKVKELQKVKTNKKKQVLDQQFF